MSHEWERYEKKNWPEKSLERHLKLNYPGCSSAVQAVKKLLGSKTPSQNHIASQTPSDYEAMRKIIVSIEEASKDFDFSLLDEKTTVLLARMPITNQAEALAWKDAWLKVLGEQGKNGEEAWPI